MPAFKDLTGSQFGDLKVVKLIKHIPNSTQKQASIWQIECLKCGRFENMRQLWIPHCPSNAQRRGARYSCTVCFRGACEVCGGEILTDEFLGVCSPQCHHERQKLNYRNHYYRQVEQDSDFNKKNYYRKKSDDSQLQKMRESWKKRSRERRYNADTLVKERERLNKWYASNREEIQLKRKQKFESLSEFEKAQVRRKRQEKTHEWYMRNHENIMQKRKIARESMTQEQLDAIRQKMREYYFDRKRKQALSQLINIGETLNAINKD